MNRYSSNECKKLVNQLKQHEEIIIQLLEIIATTNRRVSDLTNIYKSGEITTSKDRVH